MTSKFVEIVPLSHRQGNGIPFAAIRWHDFGTVASGVDEEAANAISGWFALDVIGS
jgi:hypothetical protein